MRITRPSIVSFTRSHLGLGNRTRAVLGARVLATHTGREFFYTWPTGGAFGARFTDLWEFPETSISPLVSRALSIAYPYRDASLGWLDEKAEAERVWQIRTGHALALPPGAGSWEEALRSLRPESTIRARVTKFFGSQLAGVPYVGVMIRAHAISHTLTLENSPVEWFVDRMREIRDQLPEVAFFLSCDVPEVQSAVTAQIGRCHGLINKGAYNSLAGVQSAVADLYLLAGSSYLLGPHFSSFPEMAQHLAGEGMTLETSRSSRASDVGTRMLPPVTDPTRPSLRG